MTRIFCSRFVPMCFSLICYHVSAADCVPFVSDFQKEYKKTINYTKQEFFTEDLEARLSGNVLVVLSTKENAPCVTGLYGVRVVELVLDQQTNVVDAYAFGFDSTVLHKLKAIGRYDAEILANIIEGK